MKQKFSIEAKSDHLKKIIFDRHLDLLRLFEDVRPKTPSKIRLDFLEKLSPAFHIYDFHIFTFIYSSLHGFITNQHNNQLPVGFLAQLAERCIGIAEAVVSRPEQAWSFQTLFSLLLK